jgi:FKBP-type peptidyl-prolyl cis-trans isomerase
MNPFNKTEAVGIFLSIAVMAVALGLIRFKTDVFVASTLPEGDSQGALVAVSQTDKETTITGSEELEASLTKAFSADGRLVEMVIDDVRIGSGDGVATGDTVAVHYIGATQDGVRFDSSYERGEPFSFTVGQGKVIEGWEKGLIGMKAGGQRVLVIPSDMAYGNRQVGPIAPNSVLVFTIELIEVK